MCANVRLVLESRLRNNPPASGRSRLYFQPVTTNRLREGAMFASNFKIGGVLGTGSMGIVYRACRLSDEKFVALKLMHPLLSVDPKSVHRFEREARAGMSVDSPHVARMLETGFDDATAQRWIAMELAEGEGLAEFVTRRSPLSPDLCNDILHQLFAALAAAHSAGVVHRDLKPDNLRVKEGSPPELKVLDFGIAKSLNSATALSTSPGQGTPLWTAPEQSVADKAPHPNADIWSLGLLTFFVLTGKLYWKHAQGVSSMIHLSMELMRDPIAPPSERAVELGAVGRIPSGFDEWFTACVNRDRDGRFRHASAALRALMIVLDRRGRPRHRLWLPVYTEAVVGGVAVTHDASDNGMLLLTRERLEVDTELRVQFSVPPGDGKVFETTARVVRVTENDDDPEGLWHFQVAVTFSERFPALGPLLQSLEAKLALPDA